MVGAANCGKSTILNLLKNYCNGKYLRRKIEANNNYFLVELQTLNPKSLDIQELFGYVEPQTQQWVDGVCSKILRSQTIQQAPLTQYWTCFNGPVDPFWCENLNTVLDDSKVLCLSNGERIKLHDDMRIILECENLKVVSPATISRCGVIYITDHMVEPNNYIDSFFDFELKTDFK